jgi:HAE1 family hydrophobic/amphiphilic exporter-1
LVSIATQTNGPPTGKPVWVKLIANSSEYIDTLKDVSEEFKNYLKTIEWVKNANTTSWETPGQFIFQFDKSKLAEIGLIPDDILWELYFYTNWVKAWSIKSTYEDNDIVLKIKQFDENLSPADIQDLVIKTRVGDIKVWDYAQYNFVQAVSSINRDNTKITISVESDVIAWYLPTDIQPKLVEFANNYNYPEWIYFSAGWENEENKDLIISTFKSLFIAIFLIFSILVFQFNSFAQPLVVLYSVILALLWVNIGLYLTWNPYSMPFMIWFIALTWVVVNDAIIFIDRINKNLEKGIDGIHSIISAGKTRLQPIIVTTLTTVFGVLPLALQDEFWAGLWFTIVFGLVAWSSMTLFVIPSLYYQFILKKDKKIELQDESNKKED